MERIAFFGGAFNPIHKGHLHLVNQLSARLNFDRVLFIPTRISPHKNVSEMISGEHRLAMCRIAAEGSELFEVSDLELHREGKSYTVDTVCQLREMFPGSKLYMIIGSDMFFSVDTWYRAKELLDMVTVCSAAREKDEFEELIQKQQELDTRGVRSVVCPIDAFPVSSTEIRRRIHEGLSVSEYLPDGVEDYIRSHGLYRN